MKTTFITTLFAAGLVAGVGCGKSTNSNPDLGPDGGLPACVMNPTTSEEILNACTDAESYEKTPRYPVLAPHGELPPLP